MLRALKFILPIALVCSSMLWSEEFTFPKALETKLKTLKEPLSSNVLIVYASKQKMVHFQDRVAIYAFDISTATNGLGQQVMSYQTPVGLHRIANKFGGGEAINTIFKARISTGRLWDESDRDLYKEDLVLSRILWLEGIEHGVNRGKDASGVLVDSKKRFIYIHGTNQEDLLGTPASMGCIRMGNRSVINLYDQVPVGTLVWIQD